MALLWTGVVAIAPEATSAAAGTQTALLAYSIQYLGASPGQLGTTARYEQVQAYLCAHLNAVAATAGASGALLSESVGPLSASYAPAAMTGGGLDSTSYGQEFKRLIRAYIMSASWFVA